MSPRHSHSRFITQSFS